MNANNTAIVLIGYQNDYFSKDGILHAVVEESLNANNVLNNTINLIHSLDGQNVLIVSTPICFTDQYEELNDPVGILKIVKEAGAFKAGTSGAETIPEIKQLSYAITEIPGKRGLDAFSNTELDTIFNKHGIRNVILAGVVTSVCIDTTGRTAHSKGYKVSILSDCTAGRTPYEQAFYCSDIFPIYADVIDSKALVSQLRHDKAA
ncbi:MAG TPA: cysteine hydrolase [Gammaproteobacteria bacterium]|nr:cysteine hydrolase [Gammaproteobacteria bacterium]